MLGFLSWARGKKRTAVRPTIHTETDNGPRTMVLATGIVPSASDFVSTGKTASTTSPRSTARTDEGAQHSVMASGASMESASSATGYGGHQLYNNDLHTRAWTVATQEAQHRQDRGADDDPPQRPPRMPITAQAFHRYDGRWKLANPKTGTSDWLQSFKIRGDILTDCTGQRVRIVRDNMGDHLLCGGKLVPLGDGFAREGKTGAVQVFLRAEETSEDRASGARSRAGSAPSQACVFGHRATLKDVGAEKRAYLHRLPQNSGFDRDAHQSGKGSD